MDAPVLGGAGHFSTGSGSCPGRDMKGHLAHLPCFTDEDIKLSAGKRPAYRFPFMLLFSALTGF